jgi:MOSC domain-containing protein YiiM
VGDRFLDYKENFKGQVTFFDVNEAKWLEASLGLKDFDTSQLRRNILIEGAELMQWIGK